MAFLFLFGFLRSLGPDLLHRFRKRHRSAKFQLQFSKTAVFQIPAQKLVLHNPVLLHLRDFA